MKFRMFDFEVYPNWWCCTFGNYPDNPSQLLSDESIKDTYEVVRSDMPDARGRLLELIREPGWCLEGYNIKYYDLIIANAIYQGFTPSQVKIISDIVINPRNEFLSKEHMRLATFAKKRLKIPASADLMDDGFQGSLKDAEAILGLDIRETTVPFDKENLTDDDIRDIIYYNKHDVYATMIYHLMVKTSYTANKLAISQTFGIDDGLALSKTNTGMAALALGAKFTSYHDEYYDKVIIPAHIREYMYDALPSKVITDIAENPYIWGKNSTEPTSKQLKFRLFENDVVAGNGGIHSVFANNLFVESNPEYILYNVDVASFYPALMINFNCLSRSADLDNYKKIFHERLELKFKKNKTNQEVLKVGAYKLVLNSTFGASGNRWVPLYDRYNCLTTCRLGQLVILALGNNLYKKVPGLKIVQCNTDGLLCYLPRKHIELMKKIGDEYHKALGLELEWDEVDKIWQRDVNNYLLLKHGWNGDLDLEPTTVVSPKYTADGRLDFDAGNIRYGKYIKMCGGWLGYTWSRFGFPNIAALENHASAKAAIRWLLKGEDVMKSIVTNNNVADFMVFCKKGPTFRSVVHRMTDGMELPLDRANRVYATKDKSYGKVYKVKHRLDVVSYNAMPSTPDHCKVLNEDLRHVDVKTFKKDLDYMFYIEQAIELLDINWIDIKGNPRPEFIYFPG